MDRTSVLLVLALVFAVARSDLSWSHSGWGDDDVVEMEAKEESMTEEEMHETMKHAIGERLHADDAIVHSHESLDKIIKFMENQEDHLVDTCTPNTKTVELHFHDEARDFTMCSMPYAVGPLLLDVHDGDSIFCADQRVAPTIEIKEHGELVTDGLYALVIVDRDLEDYELWGTTDQPYLHLMVLNIHGSDVANGYLVQGWEPSTFSDRMGVFLYRQKDYIYSDFALGKYTIDGNGCDAFHRCFFFQTHFVKDNGLVLESASSFTVHTDPWYPWFVQEMGLMTALEACEAHVSYTADKVMEYHEVDTTEIDVVLKTWKKYTLHYMSESTFDDYERIFEYQRSYLRGHYSDMEADALIPYQTQFTHKVGFWFHSEPESIGPMCGVKFHLPGVDRKCFLDEQVLSAAEQRDMPMIRILNKEAHHEDTENYFTLILADRLEGLYPENIQTKDEPYLLWFVMNIKDNDLKHASHKAPYRPGFNSNASVALLYRQLGGYISDFPIYSYTESSCDSQARCRFQAAKFVDRYDVELVSAASFAITGDVFSAMEGTRHGTATPDEDCETYLMTIKHN